MRTTLWNLTFILLLAISEPSWAKPFNLKLTRQATTAQIVSKIKDGKLVLFAKDYDAKSYCNEATTLNPDQLEAYRTNHKTYSVIVLCPGTIDGEENVVTAFSKSAEPVSKKVKPPSTSNRLSDTQLIKVVSELIKKK